MDIEKAIGGGPVANKTGAYDYKGRKIIFIDLNGVLPEGIKERVEQARKLICASQPGSALLITDFRGMRYDKERTDYALQFSKDIKPYVKKSALLGVEGLKKVIFQSLLLFTGRTNMQTFSDAKQALDWLVG